MVDDSNGRPGRPRDPRIEPLVMRAAIEVYAAEGWSNFTFESVARHANVGKPALYRRWKNRTELLMQAFETLQLPIARDCGSFEADLKDYAHQWVDWYSTQAQAVASHRLDVDRIVVPELAESFHRTVGGSRTSAAREIARRAVSRGEFPPSRLLMTVEMLLGAMMVHWSFTPTRKLPELYASFEEYTDLLVNAILASTTAITGDPEQKQPRRRAQRR